MSLIKTVSTSSHILADELQLCFVAFFCYSSFVNSKEQGINAEKIFHGEGQSEATRLVYRGSASLFSEIIQSKLEKGEYSLADLGSHRGEFLKDLTKLLPGYTLKTIAIDINVDDLEHNNADRKIVSDLSKLQLADKAVDITVCRYALAWNNIETQKEILKEIKRVTKRIAVIQHQGANSIDPKGLQDASMKLFNGVIHQLKRDQFYFSTTEEVEKIMQELGIRFERIQIKEVSGLSDVFADKYNLSEVENNTVREILKGSDYVTLSAWVLEL